MLKKLSDILDFEDKYQKKSFGKGAQSKSFNFLALISMWPDIVGEKLSKVTIPLKNQNGTLTILTSHPAYSQSLSFLEETLKSKIYRQFPELTGKIKKFYFQVNDKHFEEQKEALEKRSLHWSQAKAQPASSSTQNKFHPYNPVFVKMKEEAQEKFAHLKEQDEELFDSIVSIYIQLKSSANE